MRQRSLLTIAFLFLVATAAWAQVDPTTFAAFPTASSTDGRFLAFACAGLATLEQGVSLQVEAPADSTNFTFSVFDGDGGLSDAFGVPHWDSGNHAVSLKLYADPFNQGSRDVLLDTWISNAVNLTSGPFWTTTRRDPSTGLPVPAPTMLDNDWWNLHITNVPAARAPSGNYFYTLVLQHDDPCGSTENSINNLKIAASNPIAFETTLFGMEAAYRVAADRGILYPGFDPFSTNPRRYLPPQETTFDGTWEFRLNIPGGETDFRLFDGDFDHGTSGLEATPSQVTLTSCADTDDLDTAADYAGFPFSPNSASGLEGVNAPGYPEDDNTADVYRRGEPGNVDYVGCVRYEVTDPLGRVYRNDNPSGNQEWEQFRIAGRAASDYLNSDYILPVGEDFVPAGEWKVKIFGLDLSNLNFWYAETCAVRQVEDEEDKVKPACVGTDVYLLGDTVWSDLDGDRSQAASGEPGIAGVKMELVRPSDRAVIATTVTGDVTDRNWAACKLKNTGASVQGKVDKLGLYCFGVEEPGTYIVQVAESNFLAGGALEGLAATTVGGNEQTNTLDNDNVLTYDFGYHGTGSIGDYVWYDLNGDKLQNEGAASGLANVSVGLTYAGADGIFGTGDDYNYGTKVTSATATVTPAIPFGSYLFEFLPPGDYKVDVVESTLPGGGAGLALTTANEPLFLTLGPGQAYLTADFGYRGTGKIGDYVWWDDNANRLQDDGTSKGLAGVQVMLTWIGPDNLAGTIDDLFFPNAVTSGVSTTLGRYLFSNLLAGSYTVTVDKATLPQVKPDVWVQTTLLDTFAVPLAAGQSFLDADFGYDKQKDKGTFRGCTPGYWKQTQHFDSWVDYDRPNSFNWIFGINGSFPAYGGSPAGTNGDPTLLMALSTGGGGYKAFNRHAAAALLNIQSPGVNYYYSLSTLKSYVLTAYDTGNFEYYKNLLVTTNELNCPLN